MLNVLWHNNNNILNYSLRMRAATFPNCILSRRSQVRILYGGPTPISSVVEQRINPTHSDTITMSS